MDKRTTMPARKNQENLLTAQPQEMSEQEDVGDKEVVNRDKESWRGLYFCTKSF